MTNCSARTCAIVDISQRWKIRYLLLFLVLVLLLSAYLLQVIEADEEIRLNMRMRDFTERIRANISADAYDELIDLLGVDPLRGREAFVSYDEKTGSWTRHSSQAFFSSYYYTFSLATTIGYGDFYPRTLGGRLLSILVILLTLPVMILVYNRVAEKMFKVVMNFLLTQTTQFKTVLKIYDADQSGHLDVEEMLPAFKKLGIQVTEEDVRYIIQLYDQNNDGKLDTAEFADAATSLNVKIGPLAREDFKIRFAIVAFLVFAAIHTILMWAIIKLSWKDSLWFTFVTVSTVGLGDVVPPPRLRPVVTVSSLLGLGLIAMLLQATLEHFARSAPYKKREFDLQGVLAIARAREREAGTRSKSSTKVAAGVKEDLKKEEVGQLEVSVKVD